MTNNSTSNKATAPLTRSSEQTPSTPSKPSGSKSTLPKSKPTQADSLDPTYPSGPTAMQRWESQKFTDEPWNDSEDARMEVVKDERDKRETRKEGQRNEHGLDEFAGIGAWANE